MASPKTGTDKLSMVDFQEGEEAYDALSAPTFQGRGNTSKMKEANPGANAVPRKRMFDRHNATGGAHEKEKKHGGGKANWGTEVEGQQEDLDMAVAASLAQEAELDAASPQFVSEADAGGEENVMTLDEFEAKQQKPHQGQASEQEQAQAGGSRS